MLDVGGVRLLDNKQVTVKSPANYYDKEWVHLISMAKESGLSKEEIRTYLKQGYPTAELANLSPHLEK